VEIWNNPIAGSGGVYPQHHTPLKVADKPAGPLVLQHHGTSLWFKNIYIKGLKQS